METIEYGTLGQDWNIETDGPIPENSSLIDVYEETAEEITYVKSPATGDNSGDLIWPSIVLGFVCIVLLVTGRKEK